MPKAKEPKPQDLAEQLRQAIKACGMTLSQLGKAAGVHKAQLSRFLRQERTLTLTAATKLCAYLRLTLTALAHQEKE